MTILHDLPMRSAQAAPTGPCPAWYALPPGHDADLVDTNLDRLFLQVWARRRPVTA